MINQDAIFHTTGQSLFLDDLAEPANLLHAAVFSSSLAHAKILDLHLTEALQSKGVIDIITYRDIPGVNQIGTIIQDEVLLAEDRVHFIGQPIAVVIAKTRSQALAARRKIKIDFEPLAVLVDPRQAYQQGELIAPARTFSLGDISQAWSKCTHIVEGRVDSGGQEHFYLEPQGAMVIPKERNEFKIYSSTQSPTAVQRVAGRVLGTAMHKVEVDVTRLGGGFGGKEDQANAWAALAAAAVVKTGKPVKLVLNRQDDMQMTGKRHPYSSDFKLGLDKQGKILAYEVMFYQNAGAAADLSPAILERTLFHCTNSYFIPHVKATAVSCRTHLVPFTAFRGFGGPQAMFVIESAICQAALKLQIDKSVIQENNLLQENDVFPYGMAVKNCRIQQCWQKLKQHYQWEETRQQVRQFNQSHQLFKKGLALMPVCFGISFTNTMLNQASALVHIYTDGSVGVSTAAIEMGQGVNMKILQIAARTLSIDLERIKIETTNTTRIANTSPTAASSGSDLNGKAAENACLMLIERLKQVIIELFDLNQNEIIEIKEEKIYHQGKLLDLTWPDLIQAAYQKRVSLSAQAHYATPHLYFDKSLEKGRPFAYHAYGTALTEVTLDCLRGTYQIDAVRIVHDVGRSINLLIDKGQVEGALIQGIGWMTIEEFLFQLDGKITTATTSTYKVPDLKFTPHEISVHFLENSPNPYAVFKSKAIGEPPFMFGIGTYFALIDAMHQVRPDKEFVFNSPLTPEKILLFLNQ